LEKALHAPAKDAGRERAREGPRQKQRKKRSAAETKPANHKSIEIRSVGRYPSGDGGVKIASGIAEKKLRIWINDEGESFDPEGEEGQRPERREGARRNQ
jgi:hypothetical protein